jgi:hypothetical protein
MNVDLEARHGAEGATLELAVSAPIMNLTWLKSIDFGFREHLQHKSRSVRLQLAQQFIHPLRDLSFPRQALNANLSDDLSDDLSDEASAKSEASPKSEASAKSERKTPMPSKTNRLDPMIPAASVNLDSW